jgi:hypothetical protein
VFTYIYTNPTWNNGVMDLNLAALTQDVMDQDVVLAYLGYPIDGVANAVYYEVPGLHQASQYYVQSWLNVGVFHMKAQVWNNTTQSYVTYITPSQVSSAKIMIIESTNVTTVSGNGRVISPKQAVLNELENAGVDVSNYLDVCAFYGIQP